MNCSGCSGYVGEIAKGGQTTRRGSVTPTGKFPDLEQILANRTNAVTGTCPAGDVDCFSEFLPTAAYVGFAGVNASPLSLNFRLTARDGRSSGGGVNNAQTRLLLATGAGPFLVTAPNTALVLDGGSAQSVTWNVANTDVAPVGTAEVRISLSVDGGYTYPHTLSASTPNDGSESVTLPNLGTSLARVKVEAVDNIFFDVSNSNFTIRATQTISFDPLPDRSYGDADFTLSASASSGLPVSFSAAGSCSVFGDTVRIDAAGSCSITASQAGDATHYPAPDVIQSFTIAPAVLDAAPSPPLASRQYSDPNPVFGVSLTGFVYGEDQSVLLALPSCAALAAPSAAPGPYPVTCSGGAAANYSFNYLVGTLNVTQEDAEATYAGDLLAFTAPGSSTASVLLRATVRDSSLIAAFADTWPGDIRNATVRFDKEGTTLCGPVAVALLDGATTLGTAACSAALAAGEHAIDVVVGGYYTGSALAVVEVTEADDSHVVGAGKILIGASAGSHAADPGSSMHFGFNVKYKDKDKKGKKLKQDLKGDAKIFFEAGGVKYEIKSKEIESLGLASKTPSGADCATPPSATCFGLAEIRAVATLTNKKSHASLGNLTLQITATDRGKPGSADSIGVTLWNGSTLLFSSAWTGVETLEQVLTHGKIVVH